ncbi:unnamed protein product, partial [marine sediment metagenome]
SNLPSKLPGYSHYVVWVDSDGNFTNGATIYPTTLENGLYVTTNVSFSEGDYVTIGIIQPIIEFTSSSSAGSEGSTPATIEVSLNFPFKEDATIDYSVTGGTAF